MDTPTPYLSYSVPGVSCEHCRTAITAEVARVPGVESVEVDHEARRVTVGGEGGDDDAGRAASGEGGYDVVPG